MIVLQGGSHLWSQLQNMFKKQKITFTQDLYNECAYAFGIFIGTSQMALTALLSKPNLKYAP